MHITLTVVEGPNGGLTFSFTEHSTFLVGRAPQAHFRLPENDRYFSRLHFLIEINPPLCRLVDLNSHNGTMVNGVRVPTADLKDGDLIQGGHTVIRVSLDTPLATDSPPAASAGTGDTPGATLTAAPIRRASAPTMALPGQVPVAKPVSTPVSNPVMANPVSDAPPLIPGYDLERELGRGGMGVVYQARCQADGSRAAIKTILPAVQPTEVMLARFLREVDILRELRHPHIVRFQQSGRAGDQLYFAMDFVPGKDAAGLLESQGPFAVNRAVRVLCQLLDALAYAHAKGFVHRDIKPANLLVTQEQGTEVAKLSDFGLARTYQASQLSGLTMTNRAGGTAAFMPPEQVLDFRTVKPAADQYAAAATLYQLLTGRFLYDGAPSPIDLMMKILKEQPVPVRTRCPKLPPGLAAAIDRALARNPEDRFPDVTAFRHALVVFAGK